MDTFENSYRIAYLISKREQGELTPEEIAEIEDWQAKDKRHLELLKRWEQQEEKQQTMRFFEETDIKQGWQGTYLKIQKHNKQKRRRAYRVAVASLAAVVLLFIGINRLMQIQTQPFPSAPLLTMPDRYNVQLQLSDGETISLKNTSQITSKNGELIATNDTTGIIYHQPNLQPDISYNTIITPRGTEYLVSLADGSKVWLNSESKLKFPTAFTGKTREVELTGEGYFEIAKDTTTPFIVRCNRLAVQVTGTEFNVTAYPEDKMIQTTLVKGAVNVYDTNAPKNSLIALIPEHQATYSTTTHQLTARKVDIRPFVAWHEGFICFHNESLRNITQKLERWYDITFEFDRSSTQELIFYGSIKRHENIWQVLNMLKHTNLIDYTIINSKTIKISKL